MEKSLADVLNIYSIKIDNENDMKHNKCVILVHWVD